MKFTFIIYILLTPTFALANADCAKSIESYLSTESKESAMEIVNCLRDKHELDTSTSYHSKAYLDRLNATRTQLQGTIVTPSTNYCISEEVYAEIVTPAMQKILGPYLIEEIKFTFTSEGIPLDTKFKIGDERIKPQILDEIKTMKNKNDFFGYQGITLTPSR